MRLARALALLVALLAAGIASGGPTTGEPWLFAQATDPAGGVLQPPAAEPEPAPSPAPAASPAPTATEPTEEQQLMVLVADLQRYGTLGPEEVRRETATVNGALGRQRTDANRIRLAVLYTMAHTPADDQRAVQLLEAVMKASPGSPGMRQLAAVLQVQVSERMRVVREEQAKANDALQKLEALRAMERSLLRDRVRSGGGASGSGSGGGGGGGGGSGG